MKQLPLVNPTDLAAWLMSDGWASRSNKAGIGTLWVKASSDALVPNSLESPDGELRMQIALEAIAEASGTDAETVAARAANFGSDVVEWRVTDANTGDDGLSLSAADQLISTVRRVIIFGAASVDHRRGYFGRRVRLRAREEASHVRVAQSKRGSYVLPIVSRLSSTGTLASNLDLGFGVESAPFSRQVLMTVFSALAASSELSARSSDGPSAREANELVAEGVSYELSTAMADLLEIPDISSVSVSFDWAPSSPSSVPSRRIDFSPVHAAFFRQLASNLFESSEVGSQRLIVEVKSSSRFEETDRGGGVVVFKRDVGGTRNLVRAELDEASYQVVLTADANRQFLVVTGKLVEEEGHRTRLEEVESVERIVQATFEGAE